MKSSRFASGFVLASATVLASGCAATYRVVPVESPPATVRYDHGVGTTNLVQRRGAVQVTPMTLDSSGRITFGIAAYNDSREPANFGIENIEVLSPEGNLLHVYSADELMRQEQNQAVAAQIGIAALGVAGAVAANEAAHHTHKGHVHTPHGTYRYKERYYNPGVAIAGTAMSIGAAGAGIYAVQRNLDQAIASIGQTVLQTSTADPGYTVAGRVIVRRPNNRTYPQEIRMNVRWNGELYPFRFEIRRIE